MKLLIIILILVIIGLIIGIVILSPKLKIASGYTAKYVASHAALSNMSKKRIDHSLDFFPVKYFKAKVDQKSGRATSSLMGLASKEANFYQTGPCSGAVMGNHSYESGFFKLQSVKSHNTGETWPSGDANPDSLSQNINIEKIQQITEKYLSKDFGIHAITVANKTHLLAEAYNPGVDKTSRLLGWSMTKTMGNALAGILARQGKLNIDDPAPIVEWQNDDRKSITIKNLLQMQSGLVWSEDYGNVSDVTRMLYDEADCYSSSIDNHLEKNNDAKNGGSESLVKPGSVFNYASGTSNILSGIIRACFDNQEDYLQFPQKELFGPLGMTSAVIEVDPAGNYILSSYGWATARDWTRFGLLYLYRGDWLGHRIFSEEWYRQSVEPATNSDGQYGFQVWLNTKKKDGTKPIKNAPEDAFYEEGFGGQRILIIPSKELVISVFSGRMDDEVFLTFFDDFYAEVLSEIPG